MLLHILFGISLTAQLRGGNSAFTLTPSVASINACPDQDVVLSCTPNNTAVTSIRWTIEVPGCIALTPIIRTTSSSGLTSSPTSTMSGSCPTGITFHLSTVSVSPFVSRVNVTTSTALDGTDISCGNLDGRSETVRISVAVQPTSPDGVMISEVFSGENVAVSFQWNDLPSMGEVSHDISITPALESEVIIRDNVAQLTVMYNVRYHVNITAINCAGKSEPYLGELYYVDCGTPSTGDNVIVDGLTPTRVAQGTNVTFRCQSGQSYSLIGPTRATCSDDGLWKPSTNDVECVVDCGAPTPASMVIIEPYVNTTRGSLITYHCDDGLIPNNTITATCQNDGQWSRDPSRHVCRLPTAAVCGDPAPPSHGSIAVYTSTVEGTTLAFTCDDGYSPVGEMTTTCTANGQWEPNPEDTECMMTDGKVADSAPSPAVPVAIAVVLIILLVIIVTSVTIIVVVKVRKRGKDAENSQFGLELQDTNETPTEYCTTKHPGPRGNQSVTVNTNTLVYAGLDLPSEKKFFTSHVDHADNPTSYADINFTATNNVPCGESADDLLNLDSLLIQLKPEVTSKWELFARVVGLSQEVIKDLSNCGPDERMVEMLDYWLRHHPNKPTWREVAQILEELHLYQLADDLLKVYETGELPVPFDMNEVPEGTLPRFEPPPPLPPKLPDLDDGPESPPLVCDLPPKPPPHGGLPVHAPPPLPPPYHENGGSMLPPRRPPKSHSHGMPRRPPEAGTAVPALPPKPKT